MMNFEDIIYRARLQKRKRSQIQKENKGDTYTLLNETFSSPKVLKALSRRLSQNTLNTVALENCMLDSVQIKTLALGLGKSSSLTSLNLSKNGLQAEGAKYLSLAFKATKGLRILKLGQCNLVDVGLDQKTLTHRKSDGVRIIIEGLQNHSDLECLELQSNPTHSDTEEYIQDKQGVLTRYEGPTLEKKLVEMLNSHQNLKKLNLSCMSLTAKSTSAIVRSLNKNRSLQTLDISCNEFVPKHASEIPAAISDNKTLQVLDIVPKLDDGYIMPFSPSDTWSELLKIQKEINAQLLKNAEAAKEEMRDYFTKAFCPILESLNGSQHVIPEIFEFLGCKAKVQKNSNEESKSKKIKDEDESAKIKLEMDGG